MPVSDLATRSAAAGTGAATPVLRCRGLSAWYGRIKVCRDIDLHVDAGEFVALVGPNGAGKTTMLGAIAGMVDHDGEVDLHGASIARLSMPRRARSGLALVPPSRGNIFRSMNVRENIEMGLGLAPAAERDALRSHVLELFPVLDRLRSSLAGNLSGGEQQMLAIAMALASRPKLLVLDEPSQGLAPTILRELQHSLRELRGAETTVLMAEQNQSFAAALADRYVVMVGGRLVDGGPGIELRDREALAATYMSGARRAVEEAQS
jgi:branched-chain amino acid transport system ATP-binding protein